MKELKVNRDSNARDGIDGMKNSGQEVALHIPSRLKGAAEKRRVVIPIGAELIALRGTKEKMVPQG